MTTMERKSDANASGVAPGQAKPVARRDFLGFGARVIAFAGLYELVSVFREPVQAEGPCGPNDCCCTEPCCVPCTTCCDPLTDWCQQGNCPTDPQCCGIMEGQGYQDWPSDAVCEPGGG